MTDLRPSISSALRAFGVDAVATPPGESAVNTRAFWLAPDPQQAPGGQFRRADTRRTLVMPRAGLPEVPRGTIVTLPEQPGGDAADWRIDAAERIDPDHFRLTVVPEP